MPESFGIDYDGTIANTNLVKAKWIQDNLGQEVGPCQCDRTSCVPLIGAESYEAMSDVVYERDCSLAAPPVAGALDALRALGRRGKVYVISARLPHRIAFARTWLEWHRVGDTVSGFLSSAGRDKQTLCRKYGIQVLIDDDMRHLACLSRQNIRAILLKPGFNGELVAPAGVALCRSWDEVLTTL